MENFYLEVWKDIQNLGLPFVTLFICFVFYLVSKHFSEILAIFAKKSKQKTEKDIKNHQFFKDLQYRSANVPQCLIAEVDRGKLIIATDLLKICYEVGNKCFGDWLTEDISKWDISILKQRVLQTLQNVHNAQWESCKHYGIPDAFLRKFGAVNSLNQTYLGNNITAVLQTDLPLSVIDRLYIILNYLSTYYDLLITDMPKTVLSINGDLRGLAYKGYVIGAIDGKTKRYLPPDITYSPKVKILLEDVIYKCRASRARVCIFHDGKETFDGMYSVVYEAACPGVKGGNCEICYQYTNGIADLVKPISEKQFFEKPVEDCMTAFRCILEKDGSEYIAGYPITVGEKVVGFLLVEWLSSLLHDRAEPKRLRRFLVDGANAVAPYCMYQ